MPRGTADRLRSWGPAALGVFGLVAAAAGDPSAVGPAASQNWPAFVLVAGLLLVGLAAEDDGLFAAAGGRLAGITARPLLLWVAVTVLVASVTAVLNLDTSVAFLTPVLAYTARRAGLAQGSLLVACVLLSNASSLFLSGSNLTNLIVLGHLHLTGTAFAARLWAPALGAVVVTGVVVALGEHRRLHGDGGDPLPPSPQTRLGVGAPAVAAAAALVLALANPALEVAGVGVAVTAVRVARGRTRPRDAAGALALPTLAGLFGIAVALGVAGRAWHGPQQLLTHLDNWGTGALGAAAAVVCNNLPAASLLAARTPPRPAALLIGLNIGPNLLPTGSLAWLLWARSARLVGAEPPLRRATAVGAVAGVAALAAALGLLTGKG